MHSQKTAVSYTVKVINISPVVGLLYYNCTPNLKLGLKGFAGMCAHTKIVNHVLDTKKAIGNDKRVMDIHANWTDAHFNSD